VLGCPGFDKKVRSDVTAKMRVLLRWAATGLEGRLKVLLCGEIEREAWHTARRKGKREGKQVDLMEYTDNRGVRRKI